MICIFLPLTSALFLLVNSRGRTEYSETQRDHEHHGYPVGGVPTQDHPARAFRHIACPQYYCKGLWGVTRPQRGR